MYPRSGGDYVYLTRAYGPAVGFLFGWAHLIGILTGSIGALAYVFADYAIPLVPLGSGDAVWLAAGAVAALSLANLLGVALGKAAQNVLTSAKVLGLLGVVLAGFLTGGAGTAPAESPPASFNPGLALVFVLYAYGGWSDASFVAAEVRDRRRNLPAALLAGIGAVTLIYLLINAIVSDGVSGLTGCAARRHRRPTFWGRCSARGAPEA